MNKPDPGAGELTPAEHALIGEMLERESLPASGPGAEAWEQRWKRYAGNPATRVCGDDCRNAFFAGADSRNDEVAAAERRAEKMEKALEELQRWGPTDNRCWCWTRPEKDYNHSPGCTLARRAIGKGE